MTEYYQQRAAGYRALAAYYGGELASGRDFVSLVLGETPEGPQEVPGEAGWS